MKKQIITLMCATALLSSCHIYRSYDRPDDITAEGLYRDTAAVNDTLAADTANFGNLPWRKVFTDPQLQTLIEQALANNADLRNATLNVKQAQAALMSARLAYAPMLGLSPQGTVSSWDKNKATQTYSLPVTASWQIDLFGQLLNPKRNAQVSLKQTRFHEQAVQTQVIANVANMYYTLLMLDRQLQITEGTVDILKRNMETVKAMKDAGIYGTTSVAVEQSRTAYAQVKASLPDIRQSIRETENALCLILNKPAQSISRSVLEAQQLPKEFSVGIPLQLLSNRPDVKAAEMALASKYYNTNSARAAFYPQITLSGSAGWTNSAGSAIVNPGKLLASAIGSLTQPLFYRGTNIARLKQAKAQEEQAKIQFQTSLLKAGNEVSNALSKYQMETEKATARTIQVNSARKAAEDTKELFKLGTSTYLEVLSAEQSYLSAQLSEVSDTFAGIQAVVNLYQALGGGREKE
ncbi:TolC family protein [Bacteroides helcogenes]|uniref:RND efflux system, outer membrane lipoprotein, NodT family n=1 Tax=Bacteroides helcogenes (strain ATCC 35417 / DSM 20613 / JCM 6297 / CCUG 15421 / P 36-108) TaxID=693979 RepID=E6SWJ5_BACT6|nr:TolC family protein [Bacteroides helcogenes]ADV42593.1 RND efflux system, outer membrane lipoprotein, NodT family [Bacteroides helcogenes P 36-108]MDY5237645.1 TolC family protein [Bacteroides helcogenes]